jgi:nicotinamidase-related amidase
MDPAASFGRIGGEISMSDFERPRPTATALLVIDVQESFRRRPYFRPDEVPAFFAAQNRLIDGFARLGLPIVRVLHVEDDGMFSPASGLVRPMDELAAFEPALRIEKRAHSAMSGTPLAGWLTGRGIARVAVSGIRTEQCC